MKCINNIRQNRNETVKPDYLSLFYHLKTNYSKGDSAQLKNSMLKLINDRQVMHRSELELLEKIFNFQFESKELIHAVKELDLKSVICP